MGKLKSYYYVVDSLTAAKVPALKRAIQTIAGVEESIVRVEEGLVEVIADRDPEDGLKIACAIGDTTLRTRLKKRK
jgi:hypothetical protein